MVTAFDQKLYENLKELNIIDPALLEETLKIARERQEQLSRILLAKDLISDEDLGKIVADLISVPFVRLSQTSIADEVLRIVPEVVSRSEKIIAFAKDKDGLKLAMNDPENREIVSFIEKKSGDKVKVYFATERDIEDALRLYKKELQKTFDELLAEQVEVAKGEAAIEAPVAKIVDLLVEYAYENKASDIHIEPKEEESLVRFRIDGILHDVLRLPGNLHDQVVTRVKVLSRLRTDEHLSAQDGKMQHKMKVEDLDIRVSIVPIVEGEKCVLRLLSSRSRRFSLSELGIGKLDLEKVRGAFNKPYGMILATGPTGSGKTTTIYAILKVLNTREKNIATIEDPVEYDIEGINQIQVNQKTNLTFAHGLRSILRQDPDIIFVGEIRDEETAGIAVNSALTGHLVLSTLHTNDAATTLPRLIDMKVEPYLVASTVNVIIAQRLVRKICEKCRVSVGLSIDEVARHIPQNIVKKYFTITSTTKATPTNAKKKPSARLVRAYHGKGCPVCHQTGYIGRVGIFEVLVITDEIRDLIIAKADSQEIEKKAAGQGMTSMLEDGLDKVVKGLTTVEEVLRATKG